MFSRSVWRPGKQHYLQACAQVSILLYWGWYWREVYDAAPLIAAQLLFAYAFDMLLGWSRRDNYTLGFGPFPVIFSINLFLWFKPDWFYLQFLMVARRLRREGIDSLERRTAAGRTSSIRRRFRWRVFSLALLAHGHDAHHLGRRKSRPRSSIRRTSTWSSSSSACPGSSCSA